MKGLQAVRRQACHFPSHFELLVFRSSLLGVGHFHQVEPLFLCILEGLVYEIFTMCSLRPFFQLERASIFHRLPLPYCNPLFDRSPQRRAAAEAAIARGDVILTEIEPMQRLDPTRQGNVDLYTDVRQCCRCGLGLHSSPLMSGNPIFYYIRISSSWRRCVRRFVFIVTISRFVNPGGPHVPPQDRVQQGRDEIRAKCEIALVLVHTRARTCSTSSSRLVHPAAL